MKFTSHALAKMSRLFEDHSDVEVGNVEQSLNRDASRAGVLGLATGAGLTLAQWQIVRSPKEILRAAVIAADL